MAQQLSMDEVERVALAETVAFMRSLGVLEYKGIVLGKAPPADDEQPALNGTEFAEQQAATMKARKKALMYAAAKGRQ